MISLDIYYKIMRAKVLSFKIHDIPEMLVRAKVCLKKIFRSRTKF